MYSDKELLDHLREISTDGQISFQDAEQFDGPHPATIANRFGSWNAALLEAGLEINQEREIPRTELLADVRRVADQLQKAPSLSEYESNGRYGSDSMLREFGSFSVAVYHSLTGPQTAVYDVSLANQDQSGRLQPGASIEIDGASGYVSIAVEPSEGGGEQ